MEFMDEAERFENGGLIHDCLAALVVVNLQRGVFDLDDEND